MPQLRALRVHLSRNSVPGADPMRAVCGNGRLAPRQPVELSAPRFVRVVAATLLVAMASNGCSRSKTRFKPSFLVTEHDLGKYLCRALEHDDADVRRESVYQINRTRYRSRPVVIDALDLIARTDSSQSVRCAAIRALGDSGDPRAADTMLKVLNQDQSSRSAGRRDSGDAVRREAIRALADHASQGLEMRDGFCSTATGLLKNDPSRDVRVLAARVLGYCPSIEPLQELIATLQLRDFGVVHEAERALMRLTGTTFEHDPRRWELWLVATEDPFTDRGLLDAELDGES